MINDAQLICFINEYLVNPSFGTYAVWITSWAKLGPWTVWSVPSVVPWNFSHRKFAHLWVAEISLCFYLAGRIGCSRFQRWKGPGERALYAIYSSVHPITSRANFVIIIFRFSTIFQEKFSDTFFRSICSDIFDVILCDFEEKRFYALQQQKIVGNEDEDLNDTANEKTVRLYM